MKPIITYLYRKATITLPKILASILDMADTVHYTSEHRNFYDKYEKNVDDHANLQVYKAGALTP